MKLPFDKEAYKALLETKLHPPAPVMGGSVVDSLLQLSQTQPYPNVANTSRN